jgi:hypothetical protein
MRGAPTSVALVENDRAPFHQVQGIQPLSSSMLNRNAATFIRAQLSCRVALYIGKYRLQIAQEAVSLHYLRRLSLLGSFKSPVSFPNSGSVFNLHFSPSGYVQSVHSIEANSTYESAIDLLF